MTVGLDADFETNRICPLCGVHAPGHMIAGRGLYEFSKHDRCGQFLVTYANMARLALESDAQRERRRAEVAAANARDIVPVVE